MWYLDINQLIKLLTVLGQYAKPTVLFLGRIHLSVLALVSRSGRLSCQTDTHAQADVSSVVCVFAPLLFIFFSRALCTSSSPRPKQLLLMLPAGPRDPQSPERGCCQQSPVNCCAAVRCHQCSERRRQVTGRVEVYPSALEYIPW